MNYVYKNLVLEGGGVWGISYVGALKVLEDQKILKGIENVAGTSAGSIIAVLIALGYTVSEMKEIMNHLDFRKFEDKPCFFRLLTQYGYFKGDFALELFQEFSYDKLGDRNATFRDLEAKGNRNLRVFATNLSRRIPQEFSYEKSPDMSIALAARMSMSIPLFFKAIKQEKDEIFVDGGLMSNYPILTFDSDSGTKLDSTLGLAFSRSNDSPKNPSKATFEGYYHPLKYIRNLFESMTNAQVTVWLEDDEVKRHTILIDPGDISYIDFKLDSEQKKALINNGEKAAQKFFKDSTNQV